MSPTGNTDLMSPEERRLEIARLLAIGLLRFRRRPAPNADLVTSAPGDFSPETSEAGLEVPSKTVLSVHTG